ncbi:MAG: lipid II:glycine glycyltransferase FemX [Chloroflexota bacterium]
MTELIEPTPTQWDTFVRAQPRAHILQLAAWGKLKSAFGWSHTRVALADGDNLIAGAQILLRPIPMRLGTLAYLPMGPYLSDRAIANELWQGIHYYSRRHGARFLKWEPGIYLDQQTAPNPVELRFRRSPQTAQPPRTILLKIDEPEDDILARMNQGTRRKIRTGDKKGVRVYHGTKIDVETFTSMMQTTGNRNDFGVHRPGYYEMAYDLFVEPGDAALILAEHEGDPLAGIMVFAVGDTAWYLYGASSNIKRNLMASYAVQWAGIQWARGRGCKWYDLWGIPDQEEAVLEAQFQDRGDGLWGVYGFKRGWGGQVVRSMAAWDYVYNPLVYKSYRLAVRRHRGQH